MNKPEYIKKLETVEKIYSKLSVGEIRLSGGTIDETFYTTVFVNSIFEKNNVVWIEKTLQTKHGFFLHLKRDELYKDIIRVDIYYYPEQINELTIFVRQFIKQNKK
jgi:hypothetical protein